MQPKVTVLVCTFNQEATLPAALDSVLAQQTDFDFEIILADDASTDSTPEICRQYALNNPDRIRLFLNQENKGIADNYFDALYEARGRYIADIAGDDIWPRTTRLAEQASALDADPTVALIYSKWQRLNPDGSIEAPAGISFPSEGCTTQGYEMVETILQHDNSAFNIHLGASMYRRDAVIAAIQKFPQFFYGRHLPCEDLQLITLLAANGRVAFQPAQNLLYRSAIETASRSRNHAKAAIFAASTHILTFALAEALAMDTRALAQYSSSRLTCAIAHALLSHSPEARNISAKAAKGHLLPLKQRLALAAMKTKPTWFVARLLYRCLP